MDHKGKVKDTEIESSKSIMWHLVCRKCTLNIYWKNATILDGWTNGWIIQLAKWEDGHGTRPPPPFSLEEISSYDFKDTPKSPPWCSPNPVGVDNLLVVHLKPKHKASLMDHWDSRLHLGDFIVIGGERRDSEQLDVPTGAIWRKQGKSVPGRGNRELVWRSSGQNGGPCQLGREETGFCYKKNEMTMKSLRWGFPEGTAPGGNPDMETSRILNISVHLWTELWCTLWYPC